MNRCLQLDVGNSGAKWRLVADGQVIARGRYTPGDEDAREALLACSDRLENIWVSSVAGPEAEAALAAMLTDRWGLVPRFARTAASSGDLVNSYEDPARMGVDRWLAMLGARGRSRERLCVVDAGSALTIDLVAASGVHEGGYIIPGPALMERALLLDTDRVRFAEAVDYALSPGRSTAEAVRHGIALAQAGAVREALRQAVGPSPALFLCGGAGQILMELIGAGSFYSDLVLEGLTIMAQQRGQE